MTMTDPIADMLTRIRNANSVGHKSVQIPASNMKKAIAQILLDEGYITDYKINDDSGPGRPSRAAAPRDRGPRDDGRHRPEPGWW